MIGISLRKPARAALEGAGSTRALVFVLALVGLAGAASACSSVGRPLVASPDDYADYRATRVGVTVPNRLAAAKRYLTNHPKGAWKRDVAAWFAEVEPLFYEASLFSPRGLQSYLTALPAGPHAGEAAQRLLAFEEEARARKGERLAEHGASIERRLEMAARGRALVLETYATWLHHFLTLPWGHRTYEARAEFIDDWRLEPPPARCQDDVCTKLLSLPYTVQDQGKPVSFVAVMEITLRLSNGSIAQAEIAGPELFSRLDESHEARSLPEGDGAARIGAIAWAVDLTAGVAEAVLPARRCARDVVSPVVLSRVCDGWTLELTSAEHAGEDDRVVVKGPFRP